MRVRLSLGISHLLSAVATRRSWFDQHGIGAALGTVVPHHSAVDQALDAGIALLVGPVTMTLVVVDAVLADDPAVVLPAVVHPDHAALAPGDVALDTRFALVVDRPHVHLVVARAKLRVVVRPPDGIEAPLAVGCRATLRTGILVLLAGVGVRLGDGFLGLRAVNAEL